MSPAVVLAHDHTLVRDGVSPWFEAQAGLCVAAEAVEERAAVRRPLAGLHPRVSSWTSPGPDSTASKPPSRSGKRDPGSQNLFLPSQRFSRQLCGSSP
jgi:hypothetical protein